MMHRTKSLFLTRTTLFLCFALLCFMSNAGSVVAGEPLSVVFTPYQEAVLSAQVFSRVQNIKREMGQTFNKGDVLIQLDPGEYKLKVKRGQAQSQSAAKNYQVNKKLRKNKSVSALDLQVATSEAQMARAELGQAQRELKACTISAPYAGRVKKLLVHEFETVDAGSPLVEIVDDTRLYARVLVPSSLFGKITVGKKVRIQINETNTKVTGEVSHVNEVLDPASATFEIYAIVDNADRKLRSGMTGRFIQDEQ